MTQSRLTWIRPPPLNRAKQFRRRFYFVGLNEKKESLLPSVTTTQCPLTLNDLNEFNKQGFLYWTRGLKIGKYQLWYILGYLPVLARGYSPHSMRVDQSHESKTFNGL